MTDRPAPSSPPPDGCRWEAAPEGETYGVLEWQVLPPGAVRACRFTLERRSCGAPAVAILNRRRRNRRTGAVRDWWWPYCGDHLYGRWIEAGQVFHWRAVPLEA